MDNKCKKNTVYGAGEGDPSTGAVEGGQAGPAASTSCNRGRPGVDRQALGRASASGDEKQGVESKSTSIDSDVSRTEVSESGYFWNELPLGRRRDSSDDETSSVGPSPLAKQKKRPSRRIIKLNDDSTDGSADLVTASPSGRRKRNSAQSLDSDIGEAIIDKTAAELGAMIIREMEAVEWVASISKTLEWSLVKRLVIASHKARAASALLLEQTTASSGITTPNSPLRNRRYVNINNMGAEKKKEEDSGTNARTRERLHHLESKDKKEETADPTVTGTTTTTKMTPRVQTADMGLPRQALSHPRCTCGAGDYNVVDGDDEGNRKSGRSEPQALLQRIENLFRLMTIQVDRCLLSSQTKQSVRLRSEGGSSQSTVELSDNEVDELNNIIDSKEDRRKDKEDKNIEEGKAAAWSMEMTLAQVAAQLSKSAKGAGNSSSGGKIGKEKRWKKKRGGKSKKKEKCEESKKSSAVGMDYITNTPLNPALFSHPEILARVPKGTKLTKENIREFLLNLVGIATMTTDNNGEGSGSIVFETARKHYQGIPIIIPAPQKTVELKLTQLDISVTLDEVAAAVAEAGGCNAGEVEVDEIRVTPQGLGSVWLHCPLTAAKKICSAYDGKGKLQVGCSMATVYSLPQCNLQCFKCLETGHVRQNCESKTDRSDQCYRCGESGHQAKNCLTCRSG